MMFCVGQKVVCVDARPLPPRPHIYEMMVVEGAAYTVRSHVFDHTGRQLIYLAEVKNPAIAFVEGFIEPPFPSIRFRPIQERKTDISIFKAMLNPKKHELVDALPSRRQGGV